MQIDEERQRVAQRQLLRLSEIVAPRQPAAWERELKQRHLSPDTIREGSAVITLDQLHGLIMALKPDIPDITLRLFQQTTLADFGLYGYACASATTLREAIDYSIKFMLLSSERYEEGLVLDHQWVTLHPVTAAQYSAQIVDIDEDFAAGNYRLLQVLLGEQVDWRQVRIGFSHSRPNYGDSYDNLFQCSVAFDQPETSIRYPKSWLDNPIAHMDASLAEACLARCFSLLKQREDSSPYSDRVRRLIIESRFEVSSLEQAAGAFNLSPRTLRERLYREHNSFRQLLLDVRMNLAKQYLQATAMRGEEIAYLLKYAQPSVFFRAFERYFGCTTKVMRRGNKQ